MTLRTKRFLALLLLVPAALAGSGQKALKPLKAALKDRNYTEARRLADKLKADSLWRDNLTLCELSIRADKGLNDAENTKAYLHKSYDTLRFYSTTKSIVEECRHIDSLLRRQEKADGKNSLYRRVCATVGQYAPNLNAAARFFYRKQQYAEALPYLRLCLDLPEDSLGKAAKVAGLFPAAVNNGNAVLHLTAAYRSRQYTEAPRYLSAALREQKTRALVTECTALSYEALGDTARYREWLWRGWEEFPETPPFFVRLTHYYIERGDYGTAQRLSQEQLERDTCCTQALLVQTLSLFHLNRLDECAAYGKRLIAADSTQAEAYYYTGAAYAGKALQVSLPDNINLRSYRAAVKRQKQLYAEAEPYLEKYKALAPDKQKRWAPLLYKVYFALNKSRKFEETERLLKH